MSRKDFLNRRRWSIDQRRKAIENAPVRDLEAEQRQRLADLKILAEALEQLPHMAETLKAVRQSISQLSAEET